MVVLPADAARRIKGAVESRGVLDFARNARDNLFVATKFSDGQRGATLPVTPDGGQDAIQGARGRHMGAWYRAVGTVQLWHWLCQKRGQGLSTDHLAELIPDFVPPRPGVTLLVVTHCPDAVDMPEVWLDELVGWIVSADQASPVALAIEPEQRGLSQLAGHWPVDELNDSAVLVVGAGSLGSLAAERLAGYGVGRIDLLDPDRLLWHNTVRHVLDDRDVGRHKTDALADRLSKRWPSLDARSRVADVVADADLVRAILPEFNAVLCAADGIAPRRVVSHLARRARVDAVMTSVLEDGALGEVLRLRRAPDEGCLICRRDYLFEANQMKPEREQERGYGDGNPHRPMTAVGSDIALVGALAAKVVVASILERRGCGGQRLPGEQAIIGLRLRVPYKPPFDAQSTGNVLWLPATPPRPGCVTCSNP